MEILLFAISLLLQLAGLLIEAWYVWRTRRLLRGVLMGWGLTTVCMFLAAVILPAVATSFNSRYLSLFPEGIAVAAVALTGWVPAFLIGLLAKRISRLRLGKSRVAS